MIGYYTLNENGEPEPCDDLERWAKWFGVNSEARKIAVTEKDGVRVSTVFLGLDHQFGSGRPLLYETMIFGSQEHADYQERYETRAEACEGHLRAQVAAFGKAAP